MRSKTAQVDIFHNDIANTPAEQMERGVIFLLFWDEDGLDAASPKTKGDNFFCSVWTWLESSKMSHQEMILQLKNMFFFCWTLLVSFCFLLLVIVAGRVIFCVYCKDVGGGEKADLHWKVHINDLRGTGPYILWENMVDGRKSVPVDMGVSVNGGTPKWMVYNGKPY